MNFLGLDIIFDYIFYKFLIKLLKKKNIYFIIIYIKFYKLIIILFTYFN